MLRILLSSAILLHVLKCGYSDFTYNETVIYYEKLIDREINKAYHSDLPTSAEGYKPKNSGFEDYGKSVDFVVIGSGSAGSVVANRLSEVSEWNVLLLEAGGNENNFSDIPRMNLYLQGLRFNWNLNTTVQKHSCLGMIDQKCPVPRGKVLGGTSTINGVVYSRGNKLDYDEWEKQGNTGWSYKDVLPYFIKSENSQVCGDPGYHGRGGYWNVEYHRPTSKQFEAFLAANLEEFGYTGIDYNGQQQLGLFHSQLNTIYGRRDSLAKAFLKRVACRTNLEISTHSYVTKVLIDEKTKVAYGVQFARNATLFQVNVTKEVIISGGSIQSPQILMLSGVGPKAHLKKLEIPVIHDLPVGEVLQDHPTFFGLFIQTNLSAPVQSNRENVEQYLNDYGPYTIAINSQGVGFYQVLKHSGKKGYPDFELEFMPSNSTNDFIQRSLKLTDETYNGLWPKIDPQTAMNIYIIVLHPKSLGNLRLQSKDPYQFPLVNINSLSDPKSKDIETMYQGLLTIKKLIQAEALRKINASIIYADYPRCRNHVKDSKEYWYCCFRELTAHTYHPISTCRMGPNAKEAVVDDRLRVHGIKGLRVADASVIPCTISGHTSAPAAMIGEKVSDMIKLDYNKNIQVIDNTIW